MSAALGEKGEWTLAAIDVMSAWSGEPDRLADRLAAYARSEQAGAMKLTIGFVNLTAMLLYRLREESGIEIGAVLGDAAAVMRC